jgi:hypothetical protein
MGYGLLTPGICEGRWSGSSGEGMMPMDKAQSWCKDGTSRDSEKGSLAWLESFPGSNRK